MNAKRITEILPGMYRFEGELFHGEAVEVVSSLGECLRVDVRQTLRRTLALAL
jgi:hypothetical protein